MLWSLVDFRITYEDMQKHFEQITLHDGLSEAVEDQWPCVQFKGEMKVLESASSSDSWCNPQVDHISPEPYHVKVSRLPTEK